MRLIDADELLGIEKIHATAARLPESRTMMDQVLFDIEQMPTIDAVPVVRCKDCKWHGKPGCAIEIVDDSDRPGPDDYCCYAERKLDGGAKMIDKSLRKATAERFGDLIVVRMTGGPDCLWMNMYLDGKTGQMTCDSDIGSYAYHCGRHTDKGKSWTDFYCDRLSDEDWLLRKCCGERNAETYFDEEKSKLKLMMMFIEENGEDADTDDLEACLEIAGGYRDAREWAVALSVAADEKGVSLPDDWWYCTMEDYTPWQRRFAEICREVIVPAIRKMDETRCG